MLPALRRLVPVLIAILLLAPSGTATAAPARGRLNHDDTPWAPATLLSDPTVEATGAVVAGGPAGVACVLFRDAATGLVSRCSLPDGSWSAAMTLHPTADGTTSSVTLAFDQAGVAYAAWRIDSAIFAATRSTDGFWTAREPVAQVGVGQTILSLNTALAPDGTLHVGWAEGVSGAPTQQTIYHRARAAGGGWSDIKELTAGATTLNPGLAMALDGTGALHVSWTIDDPASYTTGSSYRYREASGAWSATIPMPELPQSDGEFFTSPARVIAADSSGNVHAVAAWASYGEPRLYHAFRPAGGPWGPLGVVPSSVCPVSVSPNMDASGRLHLSYASWCEAAELITVHRRTDGSWSTPTVIAPALDESSYVATFAAAVNSAGDAHAVWGTQGYSGTPHTRVGFRMLPFYGTAPGVETIWTPATHGENATPAIALDAAGKVWVAWSVHDWHDGGDGQRVYVTSHEPYVPTGADDGDGVSDQVEQAAPNGGDGNNDGVPDAEQANVTSLPNSTDGSYVTLVAPAGTAMTSVTAAGNPAPGTEPPGTTFPIGFLDFTIEGLSNGAATSVILLMENQIVLDSYYKYGPTPDNSSNHWYAFDYDGTTGAEVVNGHTIVLHFVDGGRGDADLTANGIIVDPGAPVDLPNRAPQVTVTAPAPFSVFPAGAEVAFTANFTDMDKRDLHAVKWTFRSATLADPIELSGNVVEWGGSGEVALRTRFTTPGVYHVQVTVNDGAADGTAILLGPDGLEATIVVYDPGGGFVTGGGWISSLPGACRTATCTANTTGKATFGFVSKYQKGASVPTGQTEFQFKAGGLDFQSTAYDWLVAAGPQAKYKGVGAVNGAGVYGFMISAIDGQVQGGGGADKFRIKIWDKTGGQVIYDNQMGASDDALPSTALGGGSIVIHR